MPSSQAGRAGAALLIGALVVLVFVVADFRAGESRYRELAARARHAHSIVDTAEDALSALKDAETGQRGFLITQDEAYLSPYQTGVEAWGPAIRRLEDLTRDDPGLRAVVETFSADGEAKVAELHKTVAAAREGDRRAAFARLESGYGQAVMDHARKVAREIVDREEAAFERFENRAVESEKATHWGVETAAVAMFFLTLAGTLLLRQALVNERLLASGLEKSERRYRDLAESLEQQVEARTLELQHINEELQAFTYSVSHDLRAPLRAIDGFSMIVLEDHAGGLPPDAREMLERVRTGVKRMNEIIRSLLDLSSASRAELRRQTVSISAIAESVIAGLRQADPGRDVEVMVEPGLTADGDPLLIRIVLENLLSNAWKFTSRREQSRIEVGAIERDGGREFYVRDNGAGFDPAYAAKLFKPFQRLHSQSEFEGTGIGLATAQRVVRRHGGEIRAEGDDGKGAIFYFSLAPGVKV